MCIKDLLMTVHDIVSIRLIDKIICLFIFRVHIKHIHEYTIAQKLRNVIPVQSTA